MDLGNPVSYLVLPEGADVMSSDGHKVGTVEHVLAVPEVDVFDGVIVDMRGGPGGHRFADADQVEAIYERGVVLTVDRSGGRAAPAAGGEPGRDGGRPRRRHARRAGRQAQARLGLPVRQV